MRKDDAKKALYEIGKRYPLLLGLMAKKVDDSTVGNYWAGMLESCEKSYVEEVCEDYCDGFIRIPDQMDQLIYDIRAEAISRRQRELDKFVQHQRYHVKPINTWEYVRQDKIGNIAIRLGVAVREKRLSKEDNNLMMDELFAWERGEISEPEWVERYRHGQGS